MRRRRWFIVARRIVFVLGLLIVFLSIGLRARTYLLTRKIHEVLAGLERLQIDKTSEAELLRTVPYLGPAYSGRDGAYRAYRAEIMNMEDRYYYYWTKWVPDFFLRLGWERDSPSKWNPLGAPRGVSYYLAYALGWRYLSFVATVIVRNGTVSSTYYELAPDVFFGWPASNFVVARSTHGFWADHFRSVPVHSADDENPDFRFGPVSGQFPWLPGRDSSIGVAYTQNAPRDLVSHAFQLDLSCYWALRGCDSVEQVAPLLWKDRTAIEEAAAARLRSSNPCPDQVLAGRVRTLADLKVALLEAVKSDDRDRGSSVNLRLLEVIRGDAHEAFQLPVNAFSSTNPLSLNPQPGERFLYFAAGFQTCQILPATPSAEAAVRNASLPLRRVEEAAPIGPRL
jgi:hypothetical protein